MKMFKPTKIIAAVIITCTFGFGFDTPYGDHFYTMEGADSLLSGAVTIGGIISSAAGNFIQLADNRTSGYIILALRQSAEPYNRGLPPWNGKDDSGMILGSGMYWFSILAEDGQRTMLPITLLK